MAYAGPALFWIDVPANKIMNSKDTESDRGAPPPIPAFALRGSLSPLLTLPALIPALVVMFAPLDILDRASMLRIFTNWMVAHVPYMDGHANSTIYPQMALLVNCLIVALVPYTATVVLFQSIFNYPYLLRRYDASTKPVLRIFRVLLAFNGRLRVRSPTFEF